MATSMRASGQHRNAHYRAHRPITEAMRMWDGTVTPAAFARLQEVMSLDIFSENRADGSGRIRPSSLSDPCMRQQLFSYRGERPLVGDTRYMDSGTWAHYRWQLNLLSAGILTDIEYVVEYSPWFLKGSIDGLIVDGTPLEIKQMGSKWYDVAVNRKSRRPHKWHMFQTHGYMKALGVTECSLLYENRETLEWHEFRVPFDAQVYAELEALMDRLSTHIDANTLPPIFDGCRVGNTTMFSQCKWKEVCFAHDQ